MKIKNEFVYSTFLIIACFLFLPAPAQSASIEKGSKVKFEYILRIDGQVIESTTGKEPLEFTQGEGKLIPGLEKELEGLDEGDRKRIIVSPQEGYGEVLDEAYREVAKTSFPFDFKPTPGMVIEMKTPEGDAIPAIVWEVKDETVVLNFNHPLAGKTLDFEVKILNVE